MHIFASNALSLKHVYFGNDVGKMTPSFVKSIVRKASKKINR